MAVVAGRGTDSRTVTITTTNASAAITGAAGTFQSGDVGRVITSASGINAATTISAVASGTAATLSANATATGSRSATIAAGSVTTPGAYGYIGWSPESDAEAISHTIPGGAADAARITSITTGRTDHQRQRS